MKNKKIKEISKLALGVIIACTSMQSFSQIDKIKSDYSENRPVSEIASKLSVPGTVVQMGNVSSNPIHLKSLKGFANELPLLTVMKQITPNGWIVKKNDTEDDKLDLKRPVSWEGGKNWIETLTSITEAYNITALVNWDESTITLANSHKLIRKAKKSVFELAGTQVKEDNLDSSAPIVATEEKLSVAGDVWELSSGKSLKNNVAVWAAKSGYRLVWSGEDYSVVDTRVLAGGFDQENGPIKQLSIDYGPESRAQNPLSFQFYQNRTLVVENLMYEQNGTPQYNKK